MFFQKIEECDEYCIVEILPEHVEPILSEVRKRLQVICYGDRQVREDPGEHTYAETCKEVARLLASENETRRYGLIGELLMHLIVPKVFYEDFQSISLLLSIVNRNIKQGFDLNYYSRVNGEIWYGEIKSGKDKKRKVLIERSVRGLEKMFTGLRKDGRENTKKRWDAAVSEVATMYDDKKRKKFAELLRGSRDSIKNNNGKRNALIMTVNFGDVENFSSTEDIKDELNKIRKRGCFDKCYVISARKDIYDDIINFICAEGKNE